MKLLSQPTTNLLRTNMRCTAPSADSLLGVADGKLTLADAWSKQRESHTHAGTIATSMLTTHVNMGLASNNSVAFSLQSSNCLKHSIYSIGVQHLSTDNSLDSRLKAPQIRPVMEVCLRDNLRL